MSIKIPSKAAIEAANSATSTMGLAGACRNWITQVTIKAGQAAMAGVGK